MAGYGKMRAYVVSNYEQADDLGKLIKRGTKLGEVVDIYSYEAPARPS